MIIHITVMKKKKFYSYKVEQYVSNVGHTHSQHLIATHCVVSTPVEKNSIVLRWHLERF